ncbi:PQ-loop-domain-containing protein [Martensiomyces pterosporus]|nr:PQ-loop-domain-containing protein [Martensiomyces pterosporus]
MPYWDCSDAVAPHREQRTCCRCGGPPHRDELRHSQHMQLTSDHLSVVTALHRCGWPSTHSPSLSRPSDALLFCDMLRLCAPDVPLLLLCPVPNSESLSMEIVDDMPSDRRRCTMSSGESGGGGGQYGTFSSGLRSSATALLKNTQQQVLQGSPMNLYLLTTHRQQMLSSLQASGAGPAVAARPTNALLSDIFGYISFACWLFVLLPQLWLNYKRKSSEGLSLGFILMWLAGDFTDWYGAYVGRLLLPAILIALYFVFTDVVLLAQMFIYRKGDEDAFGDSQLPEGAERPPLLVRRGRRACRLSGPNSTKRRLAEYRAAEYAVLLDHGVDAAEARAPSYSAVARGGESSSRNSASGESAGGPAPSVIDSVLSSAMDMQSTKTSRAVATSVLVLTVLLGLGVGTRVVLAYYPAHYTDTVSQVFGYISAAMFFIAYIPQIAWNFAAQSTEGLSAGMFIFTVVGNVTYCLSILAYSTNRDYLIAYAPWLFGAGGTLGFEMLILWQCYFYSKRGNSSDEDEMEGAYQSASE